VILRVVVCSRKGVCKSVHYYGIFNEKGVQECGRRKKKMEHGISWMDEFNGTKLDF